MGGIFTNYVSDYETLIGLCHGDMWEADQLISRERAYNKDLSEGQATKQAIQRKRGGKY